MSTTDKPVFDYFEVSDTRDLRSSAHWEQFCSEADIPTDAAYFTEGSDRISVVLEDRVSEFSFKREPGAATDFLCTRVRMLHTAEPGLTPKF
jgi:hypothetical protein